MKCCCCFIGTRGMGALEFEPAVLKESKRTFSVEIDSLVATAQKMLNQREAFTTNLNKEEEQGVMEILKIGTSAGGARPKAVIARNCDVHTKNFSFILKKDSKWELAPAYDICHAYRPGSEWASQHALSINGRDLPMKWVSNPPNATT